MAELQEAADRLRRMRSGETARAAYEDVDRGRSRNSDYFGTWIRNDENTVVDAFLADYPPNDGGSGTEGDR